MHDSRLLDWALVLLLGCVYSGAERYFVTFSTALHYVFDVLLAVLAIVKLLRARSAARTLRTLGPYVLVLVAYITWGTFVSTTPADVFGRGTALLILNLLLLTATAAVLQTRATLRRLAGVAQIAVLGNLVITIYELSHPEYVAQLAYRLNPLATAFNGLRPAGLWSNPNDAGVAMLFGFVLSFWAPRPLALLGRTAAIVGIFLTSSREAEYPLLICVGLYTAWSAISALRSRSPRLLRKAATAICTVAAAAASVPLLFQLPGAKNVFMYAVARFLDFGQGLTNQSPTDPGRSALATQYLNRYLTGPWQGSGLFTFQGTDFILGAHNMYIMVLGEAGPVVLLLYVATLLYALARQANFPLLPTDRVVHSLLWVVIVLVAFVSHNLFDSAFAIMLMGAVFCAPDALQVMRGQESHGLPTAPRGRPVSQHKRLTPQGI